MDDKVFIITRNDCFHRVFKKKENAEKFIRFLESKGFIGHFEIFESDFEDPDWEDYDI
jgi:hypothetical protein